MTFAILGPLEVRRDGEPVEIAGQRLRTLLGLLVLDAGSTVPVETLIAGVWEDRTPGAVGNALQALVSRLRAALGKNHPRGLVVAEPAGYRLDARPDQVDAHRFAVLARHGQAALTSGDAETAAGILREALALWRGPALPDLLGNPLVAADLARLDGLRLAATEDRMEADLLLGRHEDVLGDLSGLLAAHPLRERLHAQNLRALYGSGRRVEALAAYETARRTFLEELGVDPSPALADLHLTMLRGEPQARVRPAARRGNLRARLTSFVGRERDVAHTRDLLAQHRLVTLLGPGGAGKTRLAVEAADALAADLPDGVWLAELTAAADESAVIQTVVAAMELRDAPATPGIRGLGDDAGAAGGTSDLTDGPGSRDGATGPGDGSAGAREQLDRLVRMLAGKRLLIVLDNCEHVVGHAAALADRVLADCPGVRILATSREPLAITGEISWSLPPLDPPPAGGDPEQAAGYPAVRLFADRAAAVRPGYQVMDDAEAVARICRALDGLPLAIELAAARMRSMTAAQVAARLDDRFALLTAGSRTAQPRHQTLRAVVEWSWDLLDDRERTLARRLSVFAGGATLEAIEHICGGDTLDPLTRLVDKSLVVFDSARYRMLETIRVYAADQLRLSGEQHQVRRAHAHHFTDLAEQAEPGLRTAAQLDRLAELSAEHENLSAALRWAVDTARAEPPEAPPAQDGSGPVSQAGDAERASGGFVAQDGSRGTPPDAGTGELALRLVGALGWYWWLRGNRLEGALKATEALAAATGAPTGLRALGLAVHGVNAVGAALPWEETRAALDEARRLAGPEHPLVALAQPMFVLYGGDQQGDGRQVGEMLEHADPWVVASGHLIRGLLDYYAGQVDEGERDMLAALGRYREVGDRWGIGTALATLSDVHILRGEIGRGIDVMREALDVIEELGATEDVPYMLARLALGLNLLGDRAEAGRLLGDVAGIVVRAGDRVGQAGVLAAQGEFARQDGDLETARRFYERAMAIMDTAVAVPMPMVSAVNSSLGLLAVQEGLLDRARSLLSLAVKQADEAGDAQLTGSAVIACAGLALAAGRPEQAAELLGAAETIKGVAAVVDFDHVRVTDDARSALGAHDFHRHFAHGHALPRNDVIALALRV